MNQELLYGAPSPGIMTEKNFFVNSNFNEPEALLSPTTGKRQKVQKVSRLKTPDPHEFFLDDSNIYPVKEDQQSFLNKFCNEKMSGMANLPTAKWGLICNTVCFFYFFIFGMAFLWISNNITQIKMRYDDVCGTNKMCLINFTLDNDMQAPIYLYYELSEFYSNHKFYVDSIQPKQMYGGDLSMADQNRFCVDAKLNSDMPHGNLFTLDSGSSFKLDYQQTANPCGVAAKYIFNDSFLLTGPTVNRFIYLNQTSIQFSVDSQYKFKKHHLFPFRQWLDMDDEHIKNWLGIQTLPQMMKLWARVDQSLVNGTYQLRIYNNYPTNIFGGTKSFILTTTTSLGTKNLVLGTTLLVIGCFYFLALSYIYLRNSRRVRTNKNQVKPQALELVEQQQQITPRASFIQTNQSIDYNLQGASRKKI